jgi:hypothetical protein
VSVNRLPFVVVLIPPHFASSFDEPCMLKFSESCLYFINHVDLPFSSLGRTAEITYPQAMADGRKAMADR